ncbi:hypothetical protein [Cognatishimia sp.]|uniref:hypothetical protein n=1 Tax=Cognatishimia sp. TaxID=2211648 RepID=UPI003518D5AB
MKRFYFAWAVVLTTILVLQEIYGPQILIWMGALYIPTIILVIFWDNKRMDRRRAERELRLEETSFHLDPSLRIDDKDQITARVSNTGSRKLDGLRLEVFLDVSHSSLSEGDVSCSGTFLLSPVVETGEALRPGMVQDVTIHSKQHAPSLSLPIEREPYLLRPEHAALYAAVARHGGLFEFLRSGEVSAVLECRPSGDFLDAHLFQTARLNF